MYKQKVQAYYDYTLPLFALFWHGNTQAVHYGIWDNTTKGLKDALLNTNKILAEEAHISPGQLVLDAGCGVGGSSFWLAKNKGAHTIGITISQKQLDKARKLAKKLDLENQTEFSLQDYTQTNFPDSIFDVVWALESVCHAVDKKDFIKEAFRILKPNGRLIVADGFMEKGDMGDNEKKMFQDFLRGLALDNLASATSFEEQLESAGFKNVRNIDKTKEILPTAIKIARMSRWSLPLSRITTFIDLTPRMLVDNNINIAGIKQLYLFRNRVLSYRIFVAEK